MEKVPPDSAGPLSPNAIALEDGVVCAATVYTEQSDWVNSVVPGGFNVACQAPQVSIPLLPPMLLS